MRQGVSPTSLIPPRESPPYVRRVERVRHRDLHQARRDRPAATPAGSPVGFSPEPGQASWFAPADPEGSSFATFTRRVRHGTSSGRCSCAEYPSFASECGISPVSRPQTSFRCSKRLLLAGHSCCSDRSHRVAAFAGTFSVASPCTPPGNAGWIRWRLSHGSSFCRTGSLQRSW